VIEFLHRVVNTFEDYFTECTESTLKDNYVIVYEVIINSLYTSSSAVTERPRDASCLSSTIPRVQSFIISYFGFIYTHKFCAVVFGIR